MTTQFNNIRAVSFDFDGVIVLDSDAVFKKDAWGVALSQYDGYQALVAEGNTLYGNGKPGGRKEILRFIIEKLGFQGEELEERLAVAAEAFEQHVQSNIVRAGMVPGTREMLEALHARGIALYLNSGTATAPLRTSAAHLGIDDLITESLGSTPDPVGGGKVTNLQYIAGREGLSPEAILMVGDGGTDLRAAQEYGCPFLGVANRHNHWAESEQPFPFVTRLGDIPALIG